LNETQWLRAAGSQDVREDHLVARLRRGEVVTVDPLLEMIRRGASANRKRRGREKKTQRPHVALIRATTRFA